VRRSAHFGDVRQMQMIVTAKASIANTGTNQGRSGNFMRVMPAPSNWKPIGSRRSRRNWFNSESTSSSPKVLRQQWEACWDRRHRDLR